jgi:hypothetical protein
MRSVGWALLVLSAAGCGSDGLGDGGIDATIADLSTRLSDLATAPPIDSGNLCATFALAPWPVSSLTAVDGNGNLRHGRAIRILVDNEGGQGCDVPADLEVTVTPDPNKTDSVSVQAREWRAAQSEPCTGLGFEVQKVITVGDSDGLTNSALKVQDLSSKGIVQYFAVEYVGMPGPNPDCTAAALAAACTLDCQCAAADPRARCIPTGPDGGVCAISCSVDVDCPDDLPYCELPSVGPKYVCSATRALPGCSSGPMCLPGTMCDAMTNRCVPVEGVLDGACFCSGDCLVGRLCTNQKRCVDPCATIRDCPTGATACTGGFCQ